MGDEEVVIGVFAQDRRQAVELAGLLGPDAVVPDGPIGPALRTLWPRLGSAVFFLGTEATVRLVAPLLRGSDPAVVCVDGGFTVSLLGGADTLAERIADVLDNSPVLTSAAVPSPLADLVELLDATVDGDLAACTQAILAGEPVVLNNPLGFPLPAMPDNVLGPGYEAAWTIQVDDRLPTGTPREHVVRVVPRTLVIGLGVNTGISSAVVSSALAELEAKRRLDLRAIRAFATETRVEDGVAVAVEDWGFWHSTSAPLLSYPLDELDFGDPDIAEAAALRAAVELSAGGRVEVAAERVRGVGVTVAATRVLPRGRLALVGLGPGGADERTPRAEAELRRASVVVGPSECVEQVLHLLRPGTRVQPDGAVGLAEAGAAVAYVGHGAGPLVDGPVRADIVRVIGSAG